MLESKSPLSSEGVAEVNGIEMFFVRAGEGYPLLLLHGGTGSHVLWNQHIPILSEKYEVFVPDLRGHGKSPNPLAHLSYSQIADDIAALINSLELNSPLVCGWSDGGHITLEIGLRHQASAGALVLGGIQFELTDEYFQSLHSLGILGPGEVDVERVEQNAPEWIPRLKEFHVASDDHWLVLLRQISELWTTQLDYPVDTLRQIETPTLIVLGDRDHLIPVDHSVYFYNAIPNAELAILPNADHFITRKEPMMFCDLIMGFFERADILNDQEEA
jgi:pimeloyl-ACP methyl ester carboxylesterase